MFNTSENTLRASFGQYGTVNTASQVMNRDTGRPRGFAFVEMADRAGAAIQGLKGSQLDGRTLTVNEAKPREDGLAAVAGAATAAGTNPASAM